MQPYAFTLHIPCIQNTCIGITDLYRIPFTRTLMGLFACPPAHVIGRPSSLDVITELVKVEIRNDPLFFISFAMNFPTVLVALTAEAFVKGPVSF